MTFFLAPQIPVFLYMCEICSEQPSNETTIAWLHQHLDLVNDDGAVVVVDQQLGIHVDIQAVVGAVVGVGGGGAICCVILPLQLTNQQQAWTLQLTNM